MYRNKMVFRHDTSEDASCVDAQSSTTDFPVTVSSAATRTGKGLSIRSTYRMAMISSLIIDYSP